MYQWKTNNTREKKNMILILPMNAPAILNVKKQKEAYIRFWKEGQIPQKQESIKAKKVVLTKE